MVMNVTDYEFARKRGTKVSPFKDGKIHTSVKTDGGANQRLREQGRFQSLRLNVFYDVLLPLSYVLTRECLINRFCQ